jgi:membrane fusion protein (multidrug efflux system)
VATLHKIQLILAGLSLSLVALPSYAKKHPPLDLNQPIAVQTSAVQYSDVPIYIDSLGSLTAEETVTISSDVNGRIEHIFFTNGQQVGKNMPIIQLNNSVEQANYNIAVTALNLSRSTLARYNLLPPGTESKEDLAKQQAEIDSDQATVQLQQAMLNQKTITAPFDGTLGNFLFQVGDYVTAGTPIVTLENNNNLLVNFSVPQSESALLNTNQQVKFTVDAYPDKTFYGTVTFISPTVNTTTRTIAIQALFDNKKNLLSGGMFTHVMQQIGTNEHAMLIPDAALSADIKGYYVYLDIDDRAIKTYVITGTSVKNMIEVTSGLSPEDIIIISGVQKLQDGSNITVINSHTMPNTPIQPTQDTPKAGASL